MFKVIKYFTDLKDNGHAYNVGDTYPREGLEPSEERCTELAGSNNKLGCPLIAVAEETKSLDKMKKDELQAYAAEKGIELGDAKTNAEIIAKIKEAEAAAN